MIFRNLRAEAEEYLKNNYPNHYNSTERETYISWLVDFSVEHISTDTQASVIRWGILAATDPKIDHDRAMENLIHAVNYLTEEEYKYFCGRSRDEVDK